MHKQLTTYGALGFRGIRCSSASSARALDSSKRNARVTMEPNKNLMYKQSLRLSFRSKYMAAVPLSISCVVNLWLSQSELLWFLTKLLLLLLFPFAIVRCLTAD